MIPMSCPSCGRRGTIPPDRLMTRMHCKKCDAVFYMDSGGRLTLGEPPVEKTKVAKKGQTARSAKDDDPLEPLKRIPKWIYWAIGFAFIGLITYTLWGFLSTMVTGLPNGLEKRANFFANAFIEKKWSEMKKLTLDKESRDALLEWVKTVRSQYADETLDLYGSPAFDYRDTMTKALSSDDPFAVAMPQDNQTSVQTYVRIIPPVDANGKPVADPFTITVDWKKERGDWWVDGVLTNANANLSGPNKS